MEDRRSMVVAMRCRRRVIGSVACYVIVLFEMGGY